MTTETETSKLSPGQLIPDFRLSAANRPGQFGPAAMPDYIARKRLKQKMLDRWENEGGKVSSEQTTADKDGPTNDQPSEGKQVAHRVSGRSL